MPIIIRRLANQQCESHAEVAPDSWDLRTQIEALEEWMSVNGGSLDASSSWIADVGFTMRLDATGGGPPITKRLMRACVAANMEIFLSEYGGEREKDATYPPEHQPPVRRSEE